jgi:hypothetical protein
MHVIIHKTIRIDTASEPGLPYSKVLNIAVPVTIPPEDSLLVMAALDNMMRVV